jgi:hypothetical protein
MTTAIIVACVAILALAASFHFYWALGGDIGSGVSLPHREDGTAVVIKNKAAGAFAVGLALAAVLLLVLALTGAIRVPVPQVWFRAGAVLWAVVFVARAVSWSRYVGMFKRVRHTRFARYDTWLYSPLCLLLGCGLFYLGLAFD